MTSNIHQGGTTPEYPPHDEIIRIMKTYGFVIFFDIGDVVTCRVQTYLTPRTQLIKYSHDHRGFCEETSAELSYYALCFEMLHTVSAIEDEK